MPGIGLQLYTLRDLMKDDFLGTLKKVREIGFEGVEFAGYGGVPADELRDFLANLGLKGVSSHVGLHELRGDLDKVIRDAKTLGLSHIVCPWLAPEERNGRDGYEQLAKFLGEVGKTCRQEGLHFGYHNHDFEFTKLGDVYAFDLLFELTEPDTLEPELDVYWVEYAGLSAVDYIQKYQGRLHLLHLKDMSAEDKTFAEVGQGVLNIAAIMEAGEQAGVDWFLVEQDVCKRDPLVCVTESFAYARKTLDRK